MKSLRHICEDYLAENREILAQKLNTSRKSFDSLVLGLHKNNLPGKEYYVVRSASVRDLVCRFGGVFCSWHDDYITGDSDMYAFLLIKTVVYNRYGFKDWVLLDFHQGANSLREPVWGPLKIPDEWLKLRVNDHQEKKPIFRVSSLRAICEERLSSKLLADEIGMPEEVASSLIPSLYRCVFRTREVYVISDWEELFKRLNPGLDDYDNYMDDMIDEHIIPICYEDCDHIWPYPYNLIKALVDSRYGLRVGWAVFAFRDESTIVAAVKKTGLIQGPLRIPEHWTWGFEYLDDDYILGNKDYAP